jgi:5-formyltetrahydrofolate cyclo-ligase
MPWPSFPSGGRPRVLKANRDAPQLPVRARALAEGKVVYMAVPRLRAPKPFLRLDGSRLRGASPRKAASIRGAAAAGRPTPVDKLERIDLVVCGSVAVNRRGVRVGKGGGYSDLEFALLAEAGRIDDRTTIVTTVHPLQVVDRDLPETGHDFRVDRIVTPEKVFKCRRVRRPKGILWDHLPEEKIAGSRRWRDRAPEGPVHPAVLRNPRPDFFPRNPARTMCSSSGAGA